MSQQQVSVPLPNDYCRHERKRPSFPQRKSFLPSLPPATVCAEDHNSRTIYARRRTTMIPLVRFSGSFTSSTITAASSKNASSESLSCADRPATPPPAYHADTLLPPPPTYEHVFGNHSNLDDDDDEIPLAELKRWLSHTKKLHA